MEQPSWMVAPCPSWCIREHREEDHVDDRRHQGRALEVPVVMAGSMLGLVVQLDQRVGAHEVLLKIEADEGSQPRFALRASDADTLAYAILTALRQTNLGSL